MSARPGWLLSAVGIVSWAYGLSTLDAETPDRPMMAGYFEDRVGAGQLI